MTCWALSGLFQKSGCSAFVWRFFSSESFDGRSKMLLKGAALRFDGFYAGGKVQNIKFLRKIIAQDAVYKGFLSKSCKSSTPLRLSRQTELAPELLFDGERHLRPLAEVSSFARERRSGDGFCKSTACWMRSDRWWYPHNPGIVAARRAVLYPPRGRLLDSSIKLYRVCSLPAVSISTTSLPREMADFMPS